MDALFLTRRERTPVETPAARPIRPAAQPLHLGRAAPPRDSSVLRPFVNDEQNSRISASLGSPVHWEHAASRWTADLPGWFYPAHLLAGVDRLVLAGGSNWQLRDRSGALLQDGLLGACTLTLDPSSGIFFTADEVGLLRARRLDTGQDAFMISLRSGREYLRSFLARRGRRLITASIERRMTEEKPPATTSLIEVTDLGEPGTTRSFHEPGGPKVIKDLLRPSTLLLAAMHEDTLVVATEDHVAMLDLELKVQRVLAGSFRPQALSLDEAGNIYLVVVVERRPALWLLTAEGERIYAFQFPPGVPRLVAPPVVSLDHVAYILAGQQILALAPDGKLNWMRPARGRLVGGVLTADDYLLTGEGDSLVAWNARGEHWVLHSFAGSELRTAPLLTADGLMIAASQEKIYCQARDQKA